METLKKYRISIKGLTPWIPHSDRLCNPLDPLKKKLSEITCIKAKKDEHHLAIARIQFEAALYYRPDLGVYMPSKCLQACFKSAARKFKLGKQTKAITLNEIHGTSIKNLKGETPDSLWNKIDKDGCQIHVLSEAVVVAMSRVMSTRPIFPQWETEFDLYLNIDLLSLAQLQSILDVSGFEMGLGDKRPENAVGVYGRFEVVEMKEIKK